MASPQTDRNRNSNNEVNTLSRRHLVLRLFLGSCLKIARSPFSRTPGASLVTQEDVLAGNKAPSNRVKRRDSGARRANKEDGEQDAPREKDGREREMASDRGTSHRNRASETQDTLPWESVGDRLVPRFATSKGRPRGSSRRRLDQIRFGL